MMADKDSAPSLSSSGIDAGLPAGGGGLDEDKDDSGRNRYALVGGLLHTLYHDCADGEAEVAANPRLAALRAKVDQVLATKTQEDLLSLEVTFTTEDLSYLGSELLDDLFSVEVPNEEEQPSAALGNAVTVGGSNAGSSAGT